MEWPVTYRRKVRYSDTDAQRIVFNGNYAFYVDDAITDFGEAVGVSWEGLSREGYEFVLVRSEIDFRSAGRLGDVLLTGARVERIGTTSIVFAVRTWEETSDRTVIEGKLVYVSVDHETMRPKPVPEFFVAAVERRQGAPVSR